MRIAKYWNHFSWFCFFLCVSASFGQRHQSYSNDIKLFEMRAEKERKKKIKVFVQYIKVKYDMVFSSSFYSFCLFSFLFFIFIEHISWFSVLASPLHVAAVTVTLYRATVNFCQFVMQKDIILFSVLDLVFVFVLVFTFNSSSKLGNFPCLCEAVWYMVRGCVRVLYYMMSLMAHGSGFAIFELYITYILRSGIGNFF